MKRILNFFEWELFHLVDRGVENIYTTLVISKIAFPHWIISEQNDRVYNNTISTSSTNANWNKLFQMIQRFSLDHILLHVICNCSMLAYCTFLWWQWRCLFESSLHWIYHIRFHWLHWSHCIMFRYRLLR